ncbi:DUF554 domain-containing protein [Clostridium estertheticum]|uniref:DUF554 domain-containing protein n=1 Tax=Clostridium estertheticum TaxID=238834 RepID=A0AA47I7S1_9CLOT|nr:DUF554 domain-containing protein [Clostridium estertheticum]MBU3157264.1 DUF554 domain-containing protein [Clostridium estertheticum]MBU3200918.1 DUF554 domain-containing protein [Clostridium estertheticum]WAG61898.1 DUF554 domain-containing protein [Clostridium estertheticum]WAG63983.1 DUF554 domain-containing protein [Clostridium estertheticum]
MLGTIVNSLSIIIGGFIGSSFKNKISDTYTETIMKGLGLCVILIGLKGALQVNNILLLIISVTLGTLIGEIIKIEKGIENIGALLESKVSSQSGIANGFVTASLVFCVGAMSIMGSLESGLSKNYNILYAKSLLDGIFAIIFSSTLGVGVCFSAISVFVYQGIITLTASLMKQFLITSVVNEMSAVGGLLIVAIGANMLDIKRIKVGNMLPAIFIPLLYYIFKCIISSFT